MNSPIRVLLLDDSPDITELLGYVLDQEPGLQCAGFLHSADHLVETVRRLRPDIVVLDAGMPGKHPLSVMSELAAEFPEVKTIVYSGYDDDEFVESAMDLGAWGCVSKEHGHEVIVQAIRMVAAGKVVFQRPGERVRFAPTGS